MRLDLRGANMDGSLGVVLDLVALPLNASSLSSIHAGRRPGLPSLDTMTGPSGGSARQSAGLQRRRSASRAATPAALAPHIP